jgi:hypothetical protein
VGMLLVIVHHRACTFFQTSIEFRPILQRRHDYAAGKNQTLQHQFNQLLATIDRDAS